MKYIRTKSFITKFEDWMEINGSLLSIGSIKYKIIEQADTIEELCDEYVIIDYIDNRHGITFYYTFEDARNEIARHPKESALYGAIWVFDSNGAPTLKSVAKMNEKGELELIW